MQKRIWLLVLVLATVLLSGTAAWADFYVIAGSGARGVRITSVPYTISDPGFYYLGSNLTYSGSGNAITVDADDVTLDLMGFRLINGGAIGSTKGIYMSARTNVEIRNGTVLGFNYGVYEASTFGKNHRVINIRATENNYAIMLYGANHLIKSCNLVNNNNYGIYLRSGVITGCVASNNGAGIRLIGSGSILGNVASNNSSYNFMFGLGDPTAILVNQNSAFGLTTNYWVFSGTTGVVGIEPGSMTNAGLP